MQDNYGIDQYVRSIPDFPEPGIIFRDVTSIIQSPDGLKVTIDGLLERLKGVEFDLVLGPESRGFIFGAPLACRLNAGFVPIRKPNKLPADTIKESYSLEYGTDTIEMHADAVKAGDKVLVIDDLLATGGTVNATIQLVEKLGAKVTASLFLIELEELSHIAKVNSPKISLIKC